MSGITREQIVRIVRLATNQDLHPFDQATLLYALEEINRLQAIESAVKELRAADEAWERCHPSCRRPEGVTLPHDKLYALLDAKESE